MTEVPLFDGLVKYTSSFCNERKDAPVHFLRFVNCASEAGFAGGFLHILQCLFFAIELLLHSLRFLLLFQLVLVVFDAVVVAISFDEMNRLVQFVHLDLRRRNSGLLHLDL